MANDKLGQEPAFATSALLSRNEDVYQSGISKRFYAACAAVQGVLASLNPGSIDPGAAKQVAREAFLIADELLEQENQ